MDRGKRRKKEETYRLLTSFVVLCTICSLPGSGCNSGSLHKDLNRVSAAGSGGGVWRNGMMMTVAQRGSLEEEGPTYEGYLANNSLQTGRRVEAIVPVHPKTHYLAEKVHRAVAPLLSLLSLWTEKCWTPSYDEGTCYSRSECIAKGGSVRGICAAGFGVCCTFAYSCDTATSLNRTSFVNPEFPNGLLLQSHSVCKHTILKLNGVCQLRLDFEYFSLEPPNPRDGSCSHDSLTIDGIDFRLPPLCGNLEGHHMFVPIGYRPEVSYFITLHPGSPSRRWKIRTTKITCSSQLMAPGGCLQYFTGVEGEVTSLNYAHGVPSNINRLNYAVCVRREKGTCAVEWSKCNHRGKRSSLPTRSQGERDLGLESRRNEEIYQKGANRTRDHESRETTLNNASSKCPEGNAANSANTAALPHLLRLLKHPCPPASLSDSSGPITSNGRTISKWVNPGSSGGDRKLSSSSSSSSSPVFPPRYKGVEDKTHLTYHNPTAAGASDHLTKDTRKGIDTKSGGAGARKPTKLIGTKGTSSKFKPTKLKLPTGSTKPSNKIKLKLKPGIKRKPVKVSKYKPKPTKVYVPKRKKGGCKVVPFPFPVVLPFPFGGGGGGGGGGGHDDDDDDDDHEGWGWNSDKVVTDVEPYLLRVVTSDKKPDGLKSICLRWEQIPCDVWYSNQKEEEQFFHQPYHHLNHQEHW